MKHPLSKGAMTNLKCATTRANSDGGLNVRTVSRKMDTMFEEAPTAEEKKKNVHYAVLSKKYGGGPHGIGDPDDKSLRKVEKEILIPQRVRERSRQEKCVPEVEEFTKCCKETNVLMVVKCKKETDALKACLSRWYYDENFVEECTQQYLEERSEYRRTGIPKKQRESQRLKSM